MTIFKNSHRSCDIFGKKSVFEQKNRLFIKSDSRSAIDEIKSNTFAAIITSPPYGNVKDYGTRGEIGHGQSLDDEYFPQIEEMLKSLCRVTIDGGALWLVLDMFRYKGQTVALPFELMKRAQDSGWNFQDMIVWDKGRNLPWTHHGKFRTASEHILLFSKGEKLRIFDVDSLRSTDGLSKYWVKFPERFHPGGKAPNDIWHIPIPPHGSWSKHKNSPHFCPFPMELVNRMITLTTKKGDCVLDPFCGTGTVLVSASSLGRRAVGFDINRKFFSDYKKSGSALLAKEAMHLVEEQTNNSGLKRVIIQLRAHKYAATLYREILKNNVSNNAFSNKIAGMIIKSVKISRKKSDNSWGQAEVLLITNKIQKKKIDKEILNCQSRKPLSQFGLDVDVSSIDLKSAKRHLGRMSANSEKRNAFYVYERLCINSFSKKIKISEAVEEIRSRLKNARQEPAIIISPVKLDIFSEK